MMRATSSGRRTGAVLFAAGVQAAIALLLVFSLGVVRQALVPVETILFFPKPKPEPVVIDARQPSKPEPLPPTPAAPLAQLPAYAMPSQTLTAHRPQGTTLLQGMVQSLDACRKGEGEDRPACPGVIAPPDPRIVTLEDGEKVKNEEYWAEEKRRAGSHDLGIAVGPGIGFVIKDPLCKLAWVMLAGGFRCGPPPPSPRRYTDAQFTAALEAHNRRRGGAPRTAPPAGQRK